MAEAQAVGQLQQGFPVLMVGPDPAISPTPYGVAIGLQAAGDLRPRQARLLLEPLEPLREVVGEDLGSSPVMCGCRGMAQALPEHSRRPPTMRTQGIPFPYRSYRGRSGSKRLPRPFMLPCYWPGPLTVSSSRLDNGLPSSVQVAPWASQSSVTGSTMIKEPSESGVTWISHPILLGGPSRRT